MSSSENKKHPVSDRKLRKQRQDGNVPAITDAIAMINFIVNCLAIFGLGVFIIPRLMEGFTVAQNGSVQDFTTVLEASVSQSVYLLAAAVVPIILLKTAVSTFSSLVLHGGIVFSLKPIQPKMERIDPAAGFKRVFGRRTWLEIAASLVRLTIWIVAVLLIGWVLVDDVFMLPLCGVSCIIDVSTHFLVLLIGCALLIALLSLVYEIPMQFGLFRHEQKMTDTEVKNERKEQYGSDEVRIQRKRINAEMAEKAEFMGPSKANMCFYWEDKCVAVRYHPQKAPYPKVTVVSRNRKKTLRTFDILRERRFPVVEYQEIVEAFSQYAEGDDLPESEHDLLLDGLRKIVGIAG